MSAQPVATPPPTPSHAPGVNLAMPADSLLKALRRLEPTTCNRPPTPILTCILVDTTGGTVTLHGTNYETHARTTLADVELTDTTDRRVVIPRGPLTTVVRALRQVCAAKNPLVTLDGVTHPGWVTVSAEGYERPLQTFSIDEWPNIPTMVDPCPTGAPVVTAVGADLASALRFPMVAVSQDETLPILGGIHIRHDDGRLRFTATDRYRLADVTLPVEATGPIGDHLVGRRAIAAAIKHLTSGLWTIRAHGNDMVELSDGVTAYYVLTISGDFPKVHQLFDAGSRLVFTVSRVALRNAVHYAAQNSGECVSTAISFEIGEGTATISGRPDTEGEGAPFGIRTPHIPITRHGDWPIAAVTPGFNPSYFRDLLDSFTGQTIALGLDPCAPSTKPIIAANAPEDLDAPTARRHLLMPVRLAV